MPLCKTEFRLVSRIAVLLIVLEPFAVVVLGQDSGSSRIADLRAVVSDPSGARIPSAEFTFKGEKTITLSAGEDGSVRVQIPYGNYAVTISHPGFETSKIAGFSIQAAKPPDLEVILQIGHCCDEPGIGEKVGPQIITGDLPNLIETVRVPNAATAISVAEPALVKTYGKRQIDYERPLTATLDKGIWTVAGTLCCPDRKGHRSCEQYMCVGGVAVLKLRQQDGKILSINHYK
jgi:hypothetical protein